MTIWHQFSSNHSSWFTVIGEFKTLEDRYKAEQELRIILQRIKDGRDPNIHYEALSEAEKDIIAEYDLDDYYPAIDTESLQFDATFTVMDRLIIAQNVDPMTYMGREPFFTLLWTLGASVVGYDPGNLADRFSFSLTCLAPDESIAKTLYEGIYEYFQNISKDRMPPWSDYQANFAKLKTTPTSPLSTVDLESILKHLPTYKPPEYYLSLVTDMFPTVEREDTKLSLKGLLFYSTDFGLASLFAYLEAHGCTDLTYRLDIEEA